MQLKHEMDIEMNICKTSNKEIQFVKYALLKRFQRYPHIHELNLFGFPEDRDDAIAIIYCI